MIRPAAATDLDRIWDIRYANDIAGQTAVPDQGPTPPYLTHLLAHGSLLVAERGDRIVGYAGLIDRGGVAYLTDLFVDPACQSATVGRQLLEQILPTEPAIRCTLASTDRRAISPLHPGRHDAALAKPAAGSLRQPLAGDLLVTDRDVSRRS